jgi:hypothetical protein
MDTEPGSVLVRALVETARLLRLDELFIQDPFDLPL